MSYPKGDATAPMRQDGASVQPDRAGEPAAATRPAPRPAKPAHIEDDRRWFAAHPARSYRVRPIDPGEMPPGHRMAARPPDWRHFVVVRQVKPGHRIRLAFAAEGEPATGERAAERLFRLCLHSMASRTAGDRQAKAGHPERAIGILS